MQWAKPKTGDGQSGLSKSRRIELDLGLPDESAEDVSTAPTPDEAGRSEVSPSTFSSYRETRSQDTAEPGDNAGGAGRQRFLDTSSDPDSAWNYYSEVATQQNDQATGNGKFRTTYAQDDYQFERYEDGPYFGDMDPSQSPQHNRASWNLDDPPRPQAEQTSWMQFILPVAVAAIIVLLAFVTLIL